MLYKYAGGAVDVPQEFIERTCRSLGCGTQEACEIYLSDEGYVTNETVVKLTEKANAEGKKTRQVKPDYIKRALIEYFAEATKIIQGIDIKGEDGESVGVFDAENVTIENPQRIIAFTLGDETYNITLSRKRKTKN